ncbi:hypothetical protein, partial [Enterococcus faecalis]|uniref:hypothetical protein n=1 Tax=Enterococcus faecalis TaxID=1351 RepID=UPI001C613CBC
LNLTNHILKNSLDTNRFDLYLDFSLGLMFQAMTKVINKKSRGFSPLDLTLLYELSLLILFKFDFNRCIPDLIRRK